MGDCWNHRSSRDRTRRYGVEGKIKSNTGTDDKFESKGVGAGITGAAALGAADTNAVSSDASDEGIVEKESRPIIADDISAAVIIPATNVGDIEEA